MLPSCGVTVVVLVGLLDKGTQSKVILVFTGQDVVLLDLTLLGAIHYRNENKCPHDLKISCLI